MNLSSLFPPLLSTHARSAAQAAETNVEIDVKDIELPALEQQVEQHVYQALQKWNAYDHVNLDKAVNNTGRLRKYRQVAKWMVYRDVSDEETADEGDGDGDGDDDAAAEPTQPKKARKGKRKQKKERAKKRKHREALEDIFSVLPPIAQLRAARRPNERIQAFVDRYRVKTKTLMTKRSLADTAPWLCFEFARKQPMLAASSSNDKDNSDTDDSDDGGDGRGGVPAAPPPPSANKHRILSLAASVAQQALGDVADKGIEQKEEDAILWVDILHPSKDPAKTQSFLVLASQTLADVVDLVACAYDQRLHEHAKHSKLVFFDGRFYMDRRDGDNQIDYSQEIQDWILARPSRKAKYGVHDRSQGSDIGTLAETCWKDVAWKVDVPGVYIHQGECEHLVRLRDARVVHEHDESDRSAFPLRLPNPLLRLLRNCFICSNYCAKFVCFGDRLSISDPMFYCERCYRTAHYDNAGQLIYADFQSFPFIQD
ncbi:TPA: hypothetical protein N0F65_008798 [Lagenidium giganteum]|uniref:snRNA-activating protein complex subunit 3 n=1 Tax=Lagenidium giganteum TaxID=4803 RepID=A0AAV2YVI7_9STRA|nr:TPA: hypothetical protein N0F65_008798 [Lagenidium giganteum]